MMKKSAVAVAVWRAAIGRLRGGLAVGLFFSLAAAALASTGPAWSMHVWQSDDGLPNNNVTGLAQTPDGYLWIANPGHLARFDGVKFETFPATTIARLNQKAPSLLCSRTGGLWVGMDHGALVYLDAGKAHVYTKGLPELIAWSLTEDADGAIWIIYGGSTICRFKDGKATLFKGLSGLPVVPESGLSLARDSKGRIWLGTAGEIDRFQAGQFKTVLRLGPTHTPVRLAAARDGGLWVCAGLQLFKYSGGAGDKPVAIGRLEPEQSGTEPTVLLEDRQGAVWAGTSSSGLFRHDRNGFIRVPTSHGAISSLLEDKEGHIWVGTGGGGLDRLRPKVIDVEDAAAGGPTQAVQSMCEDAAGNVWATTENGWLTRRGPNGWTVASAGADWPGGKATCVTTDRAGTVWIGTRNHQLYAWRNGHFIPFARPDDLPSNVIHALLADSRGDLWIAGEVPESLERLHDGKLQAFALPPKIRIIRAMTEDAAGNIWLGTSKGALLRVSGDHVVDEREHTTGPGFSIRCLHATADGSLWIGYVGHGLGRYKKGHFARITSSQGLYDDVISQITDDGRGWLWFGCDHGIFKVRREELDAVAERRLARVRSVHYGRDDGLPSLQASFGDSPGSFRGRDGRLWISLRTGAAVIDSTKLRENPAAPPVLLRQFTVDDRAVAYYGGVVPVKGMLDLGRSRSPLRLDPGHHRLQFDFTALTFSSAENVFFRYRLEGIDENWIDAGTERRAVYSRLPAGHYRFRVVACSGDGAWNQGPAELSFTVAPFFWQTWWFRLVGFAAFTVGVAGAVRYIWFRRLQVRLRELEQKAALDGERARIARDIHDDLGGSLTQTLLLLDLTRKNSSDPGKVEEYTGRITDSVRQVVQSLDEIVWAANPANDTLPAFVDYVGQFAAEFLQSASVRCRFDLPESPPDRPLAPDVRHNLFLVLKESLTNIVRHAQAAEVRLGLAATEESLKIVIADDGRGFEESAVAAAGADGLRNMRRRVEEMGGRLHVESRLGGGTTVTIFLPWPPAKAKLQPRPEEEKLSAPAKPPLSVLETGSGRMDPA